MKIKTHQTLCCLQLFVKSKKTVCKKHTQNNTKIGVVLNCNCNNTCKLKHIRHGASELHEQQVPQADSDFWQFVKTPLLVQFLSLIGCQTNTFLCIERQIKSSSAMMEWICHGRERLQ